MRAWDSGGACSRVLGTLGVPYKASRQRRPARRQVLSLNAAAARDPCRPLCTQSGERPRCLIYAVRAAAVER